MFKLRPSGSTGFSVLARSLSVRHRRTLVSSSYESYSIKICLKSVRQMRKIKKSSGWRSHPEDFDEIVLAVVYMFDDVLGFCRVLLRAEGICQFQ